MKYSPVLALVTGILELGAGLWVLVGPRRGRRTITGPVGIIFLFLAGYQFAEVLVCAGPENRIWTRLAFLDITWLPPLGLWLCARLSAPGIRWLRPAAIADFGLGAAFSVWILVAPGAITKSVCGLVLARYFPTAVFDIAYALFYQISLLVIVFGAAAGMAAGHDHVLRKHLANLQAGLLGFILPALAVRILVREVQGDLIPSVMCHFAIVLAALLFVLVLRERRTTPPVPES
jgi:hypothetical protein